MDILHASSKMMATVPNSHYHLQIWRDDWSDQEWFRYLLGGVKKSGLPQTPAACTVAGAGGSGTNAWFADTYSVVLAAKQRPRPLSLGHYLGYQIVDGVLGLPKLNLTEALSDTTNTWFIPPLCRNISQLCDVAFGFNIEYSRGVAQQQIVNLQWLIALKFIPNTTVDTYAELIRAKVERKEQILFLYHLPDSLTANEQIYTHVLLPDPTSTCYPQSSSSTGESSNGVDSSSSTSSTSPITGTGPISCDFKSQPLIKIMREISTSETDYADSTSLFERFETSHETMLELLSEMDQAGYERYLSNYTLPITTEADIACKYLRNSSAIWTAWLQQATPRRFVVQLSMSEKSILISFLSLYMLATIICMYLIFKYRAHEVIRRSSYLFNQLIIGGSLLIYSSVIIAIQNDTRITCLLSQFSMSFGFSLFYGSLLVKTYRIDRLFTAAESLKLLALPDSIMMRYLGVYTVVDLCIVILWASIDPPHPELVAHSTNTYADISVCSSRATPYFRAALLIMRGIVLIVGAVFAIRIRDIEECYNESRYLALITYNILVVSAIVVLIPYASSNEPSIIIGSWFGGVTIAVFGSLMTFIIPKLHTIHDPRSRKSSLATPRIVPPANPPTAAVRPGSAGPQPILAMARRFSTTPTPASPPSPGGALTPARTPTRTPVQMQRPRLNLQLNVPHLDTTNKVATVSSEGKINGIATSLPPVLMHLQVTPSAQPDSANSSAGFVEVSPPASAATAAPADEDSTSTPMSATLDTRHQRNGST